MFMYIYVVTGRLLYAILDGDCAAVRISAGVFMSAVRTNVLVYIFVGAKLQGSFLVA